MPQIAQLATTYSSQVFWLLVCFGLVFFVVGLGLLPKVTSTVDLRDKQIADDLAAAEAARTAADAEEEAWRVTAARQRAEAQGVIAQAKLDAAKSTEAALAVASGKIDETLAAAEARIDAARTAALGEIESVAAEAAQDIVARLAGISVPAEQAQAAVKGALAHG
ncbi:MULTISPECIES: F0F1 ATP synthase subunit B family protein [Novosphingobium]|uniref:F0F1 ATP synthase subunit B family protein n=1 Tax=Novosphingobium TaxID=165696 RepID=UPI001CD7541E|nr:ATPase [Novosphingobium percolationis]MCH7627935.1 ATPase [Pseudomonadota bacterium]